MNPINILRQLIKEEIQKLNEAEITTIPNFNLESDVAIEMMNQLRSNSTYKKIVSTNGIEYYTGGNPSIINKTLASQLKRIVTPQLVKSVFGVINKRFPRIEYTQSRESELLDLCVKILAMAIIFELRENPIGFSKEIGDTKLKSSADNFSSNRGAGKFSTILKNKFDKQ